MCVRPGPWRRRGVTSTTTTGRTRRWGMCPRRSSRQTAGRVVDASRRGMLLRSGLRPSLRNSPHRPLSLNQDSHRDWYRKWGQVSDA